MSIPGIATTGDDDIPDWAKNSPTEIRSIVASVFAIFLVTELFNFMWIDGTRCGIWGDDSSCVGSVWLSLAYVAIFSVAVAPGIWGGTSMFAKQFTNLDKMQSDEVAWMSVFGLGFGVIWAWIWLYCLPHTWTLLPWGSWDQNWWKIFPYIFGLSWFGGGPLFATFASIGGKFKQFAEDEKRAHEFEEDFKEKLADSTDVGKKFEFSEKKILDSSDPPQFTSILGDMDIHEKYKK